MALALSMLSSARIAQAQIPANERWLTIHTAHFDVHFTPPLEREARHAASVAERAYANLAGELATPRGVVDIVIADATDVSNGSATVIPRPRIVIYARPPVDEAELESYDDWTVLVLQHELTHIFHLDRSRGWWSDAQQVFGRNPVLFPNYYTPAWLTEGLAVYYESRFTSGGRLEGTYQTAIARAAAIDHFVPALSQLSLATSRFPFGESVYVYGSFVWDDLARAHGAATVPAFVEHYSAETIPFLLDRVAKRSFGETFTHAWNHWRDSVLGAARDSALLAEQNGRAAPGFASARAVIIPHGGRFVVEPRWLNDSTLVYAGNDGRESQGMYEARLGGAGPKRVARRNSLDVNVPAASGAIVYSQADYIDRFHVRGDLYITDSRGDVRLTRGARLSAPDVRSDGTIVAVQTTPGSTRLATVSADGSVVEPITRAALDTQWTAPRWSPDGSSIAAIRIARGESELVLLHADGTVYRTIARGREVLRSPAWTPDGRSVLFTSDQTGSSQLYTASAEDVSGESTRLTAESGGVYGADVIARGRDSLNVVSTSLRGDGYHVIVWTVARRDAERADAPAQPAAAYEPDPRWRVTDDTSRAQPYSPWRTLVPAYWSPTFAQEGAGRGVLIGALTSAQDVIGRHAYLAQGDVNTLNGNVDASFSYAYNRLINPVFSAYAEQSWSYSSIYSRAGKVGDLGERDRFLSLHATFVRQRARTYAAFTAGAELEQTQYASRPDSLMRHIDSFYSESHRYPALVAAAAFSNTQRPTLSISPEDGISATASLTERWEPSHGSAGRMAIGIFDGYKSLDLGGFAHQVLALRVAAGAEDRESPSEFGVGGVSGSAFEIVPGIAIGSSARTFPVRGFVAGSEAGIYAVSASGEYRIPVAAPSRGLGLFPLFVDRASLALFADAGRATCPAGATPACDSFSSLAPTLASVGAELDLDSALQFDVPYRFRLGFARPVLGRAYADAASFSLYLTLGRNVLGAACNRRGLLALSRLRRHARCDHVFASKKHSAARSSVVFFRS